MLYPSSFLSSSLNDKSFSFALGLHLTTFSLGSRVTEDMLAFSKSSSIVVFLHLHKVSCIFLRTFCWCFPKFISSALSLIPLFVFSDPHPLTSLIHNLPCKNFIEILFFVLFISLCEWKTQNHYDLQNFLEEREDKAKSQCLTKR